MTTKDFQKKHVLTIFLSYFKKHKGLFALDMVPFLQWIWHSLW